MALTDKLSNIADAIRTKTETTGKMTLTEMPDKILGIQTSEDLDAELTEQQQLISELKTTLEGKAAGGGSAVLKELTATANGKYTPSTIAKFKEALTTSDFPTDVTSSTEQMVQLWTTENSNAAYLNQGEAGFVLLYSVVNADSAIFYYYVPTIELASMIGGTEVGWYKQISYSDPMELTTAPEMKVTTDLTNIVKTYEGLFSEITKPDGFSKVMVDVPTFEEENVTLTAEKAALEEKVNTLTSKTAALFNRTITEVSSEDFPGVKYIPNYMFEHCGNLTSVSFPTVDNIGGYAFDYCVKLTSVSFPIAKKINRDAFSSCVKLTNVSFPALTSVEMSAFGGDYALESVDFPKLTSMAAGAFTNCSVLTAVILRSTTVCTLGGANAFYNCYHIQGIVNATYNPDGLKDGYFYVPRALVESYKTATNWSEYATQFRALEDYTVDGTTTGALDESKI